MVGELTSRFTSRIISSAIVAAFPTDVTSPVRFALVVTVAALPVVLPELQLASPDTFQDNVPANAVTVNVTVPALYVKPASDFGPSSPVADSNSATLHVVSVVSATVISTISMAAVPSNDVPPISLPVANAVAVADNPVQLAELPVVLWFNVGNVQSVRFPLAGCPNAGVTKVGLVPNTNAPLPVSSDIAVANSAEDPVNVLSVKSILLFVNVVVELAVTTSAV